MQPQAQQGQVSFTEVSYVGHVLGADGLKPNPQKVEAVKASMPCPTNREELQRFLVVLTYLSKFIPNMSQAVAPLRQLLARRMLNGSGIKHTTKHLQA